MSNFKSVIFNPKAGEVGERLRLWRKGQGLTLMQLTSIMGVAQSSLSDIENGNTMPAYLTLARYRHFFPKTKWGPIFFW